MQTLLLLTAVYAAGFDPVPKAEPLPPITEKLWEKSADQLKQIGLGMHHYESEYGHFPQNVKDAKGKPLLSWRVLILPYIGEEKLYKQFKLTEAWDSDHNKLLVESMPKLFSAVRVKDVQGQTFYQGFVGEETVFRKEKAVKLIDITDGCSNTAMVVEAGKSVPWTKPEDIAFQTDKPLPKLGAFFDGDFNMLMADGSIMKVKKNYDAETMKLVIQINDGRVYSLDGIEKK